MAIDFGDDGAVVEHQAGMRCSGLIAGVFRRLVLHGHHVDLLGRHLDALFGQEYAGAARIRRHFAVVELHFAPPTDLLSPPSRPWRKAAVKGPL